MSCDFVTVLCTSSASLSSSPVLVGVCSSSETSSSLSLSFSYVDFLSEGNFKKLWVRVMKNL
jgi:hypothetical protein